MSDRMKTDVPGLDSILQGGFLYHNSVLIKGQPGTGKTTLGIQIIHNGIVQYDEPGIIVLFEQFPKQLYRDLDSYSWDFKKLVDEKRASVIFSPMSDLTATSDMEQSLLVSRIVEDASNMGAKRILIDGVTHFIKMLRTDKDEREIFLRFLNAVKSIGLTPILTAEGMPGDNQIGYEDFLSDCVVYLTNQSTRNTNFNVRHLEVLKTRGHGHLRGRHPYSISEKGIEIFPHIELTEPVDTSQDSVPLKRISTGVDGLDELLSGGFACGTSTVLAGMPGTFKTTMGVQFVARGAAEGEPGLIISFNETPGFLVNTMKQRGIDLEPLITSGSLQIIHNYPRTFYVEELLQLIQKEVLNNGIRRVMIDGVNEIERSIEDPDTSPDYITAFHALLHRHGVTSVFIQKLTHFTANAPITDIRHAGLFDGVIYTADVEIESVLRKVISVLKMRGGSFQSDLREMTCTENGIRIIEKFVGISGILAGTGQGHYKQTMEDLFQPLYYIRDFLGMLDAPNVDDGKRATMIANMTSEVDKIMLRLQDYFDIKFDE